MKEELPMSPLKGKGRDWESFSINIPTYLLSQLSHIHPHEPMEQDEVFSVKNKTKELN